MFKNEKMMERVKFVAFMVVSLAIAAMLFSRYHAHHDLLWYQAGATASAIYGLSLTAVALLTYKFWWVLSAALFALACAVLVVLCYGLLILLAGPFTP